METTTTFQRLRVGLLALVAAALLLAGFAGGPRPPTTPPSAIPMPPGR